MGTKVNLEMAGSLPAIVTGAEHKLRNVDRQVVILYNHSIFIWQNYHSMRTQ